MCPYYLRDYQKCKIYDSLHCEGEYHTDSYCMEMRYDYTECANYKQCKASYGGSVPPPHKF